MKAIPRSVFTKKIEFIKNLPRPVPFTYHATLAKCSSVESLEPKNENKIKLNYATVRYHSLY